MFSFHPACSIATAVCAAALWPALALAQPSQPPGDDDEDWAAEAPPVAISKTAWEHQIRLATDNLNRGISDSGNRPGARWTTSFTHDSGFVAQVEVNTISRKVFPGSSSRLALVTGAGWRGGDPNGWNYGIGGAYEYFPGAHFYAPQRLGFDPATGMPAPYDVTRTRINTGYALFEVGYGQLSTRLLAVLSKNYRGINAGMVCGTLISGADPMAGVNCYMERGGRNSRGSLLFDVDYKIPFNHNATTLNLHAGYQHVRNFSQFNAADIGIGLTHRWQGFDWTVEATKPFTRHRELYMVQDGEKVRRLDKARITLSVTRTF